MHYGSDMKEFMTMSFVYKGFIYPLTINTESQ